VPLGVPGGGVGGAFELRRGGGWQGPDRALGFVSCDYDVSCHIPHKSPCDSAAYTGCALP
jgi:hypothetical protein